MSSGRLLLGGTVNDGVDGESTRLGVGLTLGLVLGVHHGVDGQAGHAGVVATSGREGWRQRTHRRRQKRWNKLSTVLDAVEGNKRRKSQKREPSRGNCGVWRSGSITVKV